MNSTKILDSISFAFLHTSIIEWLIFATAILYVLFAAKENIWCWIFGIISSLLSVYLCYIGKLFLESGLNLFYVIIGIYGWYQWKYGSEIKKEIKIKSFSLKHILFSIFISTLIWIPFGYIANRFSNQVLPYLDGFITAFSMVATWMTTKKILESWLYWILIDSLAIVLFANRGFYLIALLYLIYTILSFSGYLSWRKKII